MKDKDGRAKEKRDQRTENRAETDDDCIRNAHAQFADRNAEKDLRHTPTGSEGKWSDKSFGGKSLVGREQMVHQKQSQSPWENHQRHNTENEPQVLPFPLAGEFAREHAVARHNARNHRESFSFKDRRGHLILFMRALNLEGKRHVPRAACKRVRDSKYKETDRD